MYTTLYLISFKCLVLVFSVTGNRHVFPFPEAMHTFRKKYFIKDFIADILGIVMQTWKKMNKNHFGLIEIDFDNRK